MYQYKYSYDLAYADSVKRTITMKKGKNNIWRWKKTEDWCQRSEGGKKKEDVWRQKRQCKSDSKALMDILWKP